MNGLWAHIGFNRITNGHGKKRPPIVLFEYSPTLRVHGRQYGIHKRDRPMVHSASIEHKSLGYQFRRNRCSIEIRGENIGHKLHAYHLIFAIQTHCAHPHCRQDHGARTAKRGMFALVRTLAKVAVVDLTTKW